MKKLFGGAVLVLAVLAAGQLGAKVLAVKDIETIMDEGHKGKDSLRNKVVQGAGTAEDAKALLALYEDLAKNKAPKGSAADWKKRTATILVAARKVAEKPDDKAALSALGKATSCMACHKEHKPK
jgi:hypothetical protein